ncbi:hypothetical protein [Sporosarcina sp. FSL K6-1508]|uniref:hypothetical protein n=1 Tax=Sporosarcina sp. FSL K6-1508 TaxID=2921553 RepID=UPI0030F5A421
MFIIIRNNNGTIETLKDSNCETDKTFADFYAADLFLQQLNQNIIPSMHWTISEKLQLVD